MESPKRKTLLTLKPQVSNEHMNRIVGDVEPISLSGGAGQLGQHPNWSDEVRRFLTTPIVNLNEGQSLSSSS